MADEDLDKNNDANAEFEAKVQAAVEEATKGLKATNQALKAEKTQEAERAKQLAEAIDGLGGIEVLKQLGNAETVKSLAEMRKRFEADASNKLLAEGKYDEWFDTRTAGLRKDYEAQVKDREAKLEEAVKNGESTTGALRQKILEYDVTNAAASSGILPGALLDVRLRAQQLFKFDPEHDRFVLRDAEGSLIYGKDGKSPKTMTEWLDDQKETSGHWWPGSRGGGAGGSDGVVASKDDMSTLPFDQYMKTRRTNAQR